MKNIVKPLADLNINPQTKRPYDIAKHAVRQKEIIPLNDRVLIEPIKDDNFSKGGVLLPGNENTDVLHAIVLAVGEGKAMPSGRMPISVKVGDKVIYGALNNTVEDTLNGKDVLLVVEQAIVAIIKE